MESLLETLRSCGTISTPELVRRTSLSTEMIEARLEYYVRFGYVKKTVFDAADCACGCDKCRGCAGGGRISRPIVFWEVVQR